MFPAKTYRYVLKEGLQGHDVWALQIALNARGFDLVEDGAFGPKTSAAVKTYQTNQKLTTDGIAGLLTQRSLALVLIAPQEQAASIPVGMVRGLVEGESGYAVGAVNWKIAGGVDCGWVQRRVIEANYNDTAFRAAFSPEQFKRVCNDMRSRKDAYYGDPGALTHQRAWELAVLYHNWPAGADSLAKGNKLSTQEVDWVKAIGVPNVTTPAQWAEYYIDTKTAYVTEWTH